MMIRLRARHQLTEKSLRRHSRAGGNPKPIQTNLNKTWLAGYRAVDFRIRGNDGNVYTSLIFNERI
ncbi:hypothetical protein [Conchiformibius kuhniae]|uniref:Uncharacterized protein n=1 Tax=Conchiformibius kuhniae TaxID=211502 RepID=A0ABD8B6Y1_9NEIS|nr:hypothetical protein [Conchiformibius kuhniae]